MAKNETLGQKLRAIQAELPEAFKSGDAERVATLHSQIVGLKNLVGELVKTHDFVIDKRDEGMFGEDFAPEVTRIRKKSDTVGRPKSEKEDTLALLDI